MRRRGGSKDWGGSPSDVFAVVDRNSDGRPEYVHKLVVDGINTPNGIALRGDSLFVAAYEDAGIEKGLIWRLDDVHQHALQRKAYKRGDADLTVVTDALPGDRWHGWRYIKFDGDGKLLVTIGAPCNVCDLDDPALGTGGTGKLPYGSIVRLDVDAPGSAVQSVARGVRNSVGLEHHPDTQELYFTDNGRDELGENLPDCELNRVTNDGQDFGFPYCANAGTGGAWRRSPGPGRIINDRALNRGGTVKNCTREVLQGRVKQPIQAMGPHVAPLGLRFYKWSKDLTAGFPQSWDRTLFVVQRGSWNRKQPIGQRVMSCVAYLPFVTGWLKRNATDNSESWGRPADIEQLPDGSLVISDDSSSTIFRVTWEGTRV
ncbi:hypothetical protein COO60DRAFT_1633308 [Scenedesmus sp. NREL 46B-D3]|nr:hypothetical protein COO60DRAFT_1633308 [Scenedesmus sp. NREL 46B-D3]